MKTGFYGPGQCRLAMPVQPLFKSEARNSNFETMVNALNSNDPNKTDQVRAHGSCLGHYSIQYLDLFIPVGIVRTYYDSRIEKVCQSNHYPSKPVYGTTGAGLFGPGSRLFSIYLYPNDIWFLTNIRNQQSLKQPTRCARVRTFIQNSELNFNISQI